MPKNLTELLALNKFERIQILRTFGLNTPVMTYVPKGCQPQVEDSWLEFKQRMPGKKISIRTFSDDPDVFNCPFLPFNTPSQALTRAMMLNRDFNVIFTEGVDPELTILCGNLLLDPVENEAHFEYLEGPGTIRDMSHRGTSYRCLPINNSSRLRGRVLQKVLYNAYKFPFSWGHHIEWGLSSGKFGWKQDNLIFWEVRK